MSSEAFVTLATNDGYALGSLVLAQSIRQVGTKRNLVILISKHLSDLIRRTLETNFDEVIIVEELNSNDDEHLRLLCRPELGITFTKINCWLLEKYSKCVFLDSDCLVLKNIDDLFEREEFSAAPDAGWPDCFNSGVFVYQPSKETFTKLIEFSSEQDASFDGGDQGLLNRFFSNWRTSDISRHLPFTYNVTANAFYSYLPAVTRFRNDIHIVHFAGALKPWELTYNPNNEQLSGNLGGLNDIQREFFLSWWRILHQRVLPHLANLNQQSNSNKELSIVGEDEYNGSLNYENLISNEEIELGSAEHRREWEAGRIDYSGRDSFSNIQQQLERNIAQHSQEYHSSQQRPPSPDKPITTILKYPNKESKLSLQQQTTSSSKNIPSSVDSIKNKSSLNEQETHWTVKSTIVTAHTQGEHNGLTVISKVVSESTASSSNNIPTITSIQKKTDSTTVSSGSSVTAIIPNEHFAWLFDKFFVGITYVISLCYMMFLVVTRRFNNSSIIHGNETSVRGATTPTKTENRVKK